MTDYNLSSVRSHLAIAKYGASLAALHRNDMETAINASQSDMVVLRDGNHALTEINSAMRALETAREHLVSIMDDYR